MTAGETDSTGNPAELIAVSEPEWHRLHPVTVIRELVGLAWNFIGAIALSGFAPDIDGGPFGNIEMLLPAAVVALGFVLSLIHI